MPIMSPWKYMNYDVFSLHEERQKILPICTTMCKYYFANTYQYSHAYVMFNQYFPVTHCNQSSYMKSSPLQPGQTSVLSLDHGREKRNNFRNPKHCEWYVSN